MLRHLAVGLDTAQPAELVEALSRRRLWGEQAVPRRVKVDAVEVPPSADWRERYLDFAADPATSDRTVAAYFDTESDRYLDVRSDRLVKAAFDFAGGAPDVATFLSELPFDFASFATLHREWFGRLGYRRIPRFGGGHYPHGWACAFRGDGHRFLVSRRWLDLGPWQVLRGPDDTTLVQFHDLDADAATALEQARPAHRLMDDSEVGGFLPEPYLYSDDVKGVYDERRRVLKKIVLGRAIGLDEMRDACAARRDDVFGPERPVDSVAYIFPDADEAYANLPRLWPYGLECWTVVDGRETRLDTDEVPEGTDIRREL
ncbi:MAG: hypothetical protein HOV68_29340 [Streptomycetaceae bacterium]|nr:hypothetical protein [Streptomycetaceae bacterium]